MLALRLHLSLLLVSFGLTPTTLKRRMYVWTGSAWEPVLPQPDLDGYATQGYVDAKTAGLPYRIETDKVLRAGKADVRSGEVEIRLVDNQDNYSNVKFSRNQRRRRIEHGIKHRY